MKRQIIAIGGGGFGRPEDRDVDAVAGDVASGYISRSRAENVYRVKLKDTGILDVTATKAARDDVHD